MSFDSLVSAANPAFFSTFSSSIQILLSGVPVFSCQVIDNTDPGYQNVAGVGLVSAEPNILLMASDAARIVAMVGPTATPTLRINGVD